MAIPSRALGDVFQDSRVTIEKRPRGRQAGLEGEESTAEEGVGELTEPFPGDTPEPENRIQGQPDEDLLEQPLR